jgi:hypothetical protein
VRIGDLERELGRLRGQRDRALARARLLSLVLALVSLVLLGLSVGLLLRGAPNG